MAGRYSRTLSQGVGGGVAADGRGQRVRPWLPVLLWFVVVMGFSQGTFSAEWSRDGIGPLVRLLGLTPEQAVLAHYFLRKAAHVAEYALLGLLTFRAVLLSLPALPPRLAAGAALALALGVASLDEWNQAYEPTRTGSSRDVAIDVSGALAGILFWSVRRAPLR
jgi:VanZ family protein